MTAPTVPDTLTRCPYTFRPLQNPNATRSEYVDRELPPGWAGSGTLCIALAGARASGKSLYIAVLVKLLEQLAESRGKVIRGADESTRERYRENYEEPLFEEMGLMAPTPRMAAEDAYQRDPLIFDLGMWDVGGGPRKFFLVIRDVAGEDLEVLPDDPETLGFFREADEIIFLFDPLKVPQIRNYLSGLVPDQSLGGDPVEVLQNILHVLGDSRPQLAVTLSKFDTLQELEQVADSEWCRIMGNYGAAYRRDTGLRFDDVDSSYLNSEIHSMLLKLNAARVVHTLEEAYAPVRGQWRYFATSALGAPPQGAHLHRSGIAPYRCLDPVMWLLTGRGLFR